MRERSGPARLSTPLALGKSPSGTKLSLLIKFSASNRHRYENRGTVHFQLGVNPPRQPFSLTCTKVSLRLSFSKCCKATIVQCSPMDRQEQEKPTPWKVPRVSVRVRRGPEEEREPLNMTLPSRWRLSRRSRPRYRTGHHSSGVEWYIRQPENGRNCRVLCKSQLRRVVQWGNIWSVIGI